MEIFGEEYGFKLTIGASAAIAELCPDGDLARIEEVLDEKRVAKVINFTASFIEAMAKDIGPRIGIDGEAQYRREIEQIISQAKTLDAEMKELTSSFDKEASAKKKNAAVSEQIAKQIEVQKERIQKLEEMVQRSAEATGENSTQTNKWKEALANAKTELNHLESGLETSTQKSSVFAETLKAMFSKELIMGGLKMLKDGVVELGKATASLAKEVVSAYGEYEQLEGGVKKLFREQAAQQVIRNATQAYKTAGMSMNDYMETVTSFSASLINSLGGDTEQAARMADIAIRDMSDNANTFGTDIASIQSAYQGFAKGTYTMLDNLKLGYGGTKSEMERLVLDAENLNSTFKAQRDTNGNLALSFADIVAAIDIVQGHMNITGATAAEASGTVQGSISSLKAAMQNFVVGLGTDTADIDQLLGNVVTSFEDVVSNVQPILERFLDYIPGVVSAVIPVLQSMAPQLISTAVQLFTAFVNAIVSVLPDLIPVAIDAIKLLANTLIQNLPTIIEAGIQLIVGLIDGFAQTLPTLIEQAPRIISTIANAIINNLPTIITAGVQIIQALIEGLISMAGNLPQVAYDILLNLKDTFAGGVEAAWGWGKDLIINFANGIIEHTKEVWNSVKNVAQSIWDLLHFSEPETGPLKNFHTFAPDMMKEFASGISRNQHLVSEAASQAMEGVSNAMSAGNATSNAYNYGGFNISVYQQPGESTDALVDRLMYAMQNRIDARKAVYGT